MAHTALPGNFEFVARPVAQVMILNENLQYFLKYTINNHLGGP